MDKRRVSYCRIGTTIKPKESEPKQPEPKVKSTKEIPTIQGRKGSFTKSSIFEHTETSTCDTGSGKMGILNLKTQVDTGFQLKMSSNPTALTNNFITPIKSKKKIIFGDSGTGTKVSISPMIIQSVNTTAHSIHDSGRKTREKSLKSRKSLIASRRISLTCGKNLKTKKVIKYKTKVQPKYTKEVDPESQPKRLNIRNKELHVQAVPYSELKEYIEGHNQISEKGSRVKAKYVRSMT